MYMKEHCNLLFQAYERRFPTCKMIPVFVGSDIVLEEKSEDGATHTIERRCKLNVDAPYILKKVSQSKAFIICSKTVNNY